MTTGRPAQGPREPACGDLDEGPAPAPPHPWRHASEERRVRLQRRRALIARVHRTMVQAEPVGDPGEG